MGKKWEGEKGKGGVSPQMIILATALIHLLNTCLAGQKSVCSFVQLCILNRKNIAK